MIRSRTAWIAVFASLLAGSAVAAQTPSAGQQAPAKPAAKSAPRPAGAKPGTAGAKRPVAPALKTPKEKSSYAIGLNIGKGMQKDGVEVDPESLARGVRDALSGAKPLLSDEEARASLTALASAVHAKMEAKHRKAGAEYLAANKGKEGVVELPSGLQYKVLKEGSGVKPGLTDRVVCNYRGTLIDGTEFDSSYKRGEPATFAVNQVIKGWTEALQLMPVGSKWQLVLPADLAYGSQQMGQEIAPGSTLVFEVELLSIQPHTEAQPAGKPESH